MAHEDIVRTGPVPGEPSSSGDPKFKSLNFLENLPTVLKSDPANIQADFTNTVINQAFDWWLLPFAGDKTPDEFLSESTAKTLDDFLIEFGEAYGGGPINDAKYDLRDAIFKDYLNFLNYTYTTQSPPGFRTVRPVSTITGGDLSDLGFNYSEVLTQMKNTFSHFLTTTSINNRNTKQKFYNSWRIFMAATSQAKDSTDPSDPKLAIDMLAYEKIHNAFFDSSEYVDRLKEFADKVLEETGNGDPAKGWFIPSHNFSQWFEELRDEYLKSIGTGQFNLTTVSVSEFNEDGTKNFKSAKSLLTIDRILKLLVYMIDVLQRISALQATYLGYLTDWQKEYTDHLNDIPVFTEGDGSLLAGIVTDGPRLKTPPGGGAKYIEAGGDPYTDTEASETNTKIRYQRAETNTEMQALQEKIRGKRGLIQDTAKQMQTTINQSQDGANQQVQMATALLQQLGTIISQIFR